MFFVFCFFKKNMFCNKMLETQGYLIAAAPYHMTSGACWGCKSSLMYDVAASCRPLKVEIRI